MDKPEEVTEKVEAKAQNDAGKRATGSANLFYVIGQRDAAATFLAMIRAEGLSAVEGVAKELLESDPGHPHAKWILENPDEWKRTAI